MARFALVALCAIGALAGASALSPLEYGVEMLDRAFTSVCWYETLKVFPETDSKGWGQCGSTIGQFKDMIFNPKGSMAAHLKKYPEQKASTLANSLAKNGMSGIDKEYNQKCGKYLEKLDDAPPADEADALNDNYKGDYPFKAFNFCLMKTLRQRKGDQAIEAVKQERTHIRKNWMQTLLDRENEFRARHGSKPLKLVGDLNQAAQEWANQMSKDCMSRHTANEDPGRQWNGKGTGESLAEMGGPKDGNGMAYVASDGWYEENKVYPWPEFKGNDKKTFEKIGHFTQSVWAESEYVGYGYAYNPDCKMYGNENMIVARYSPAGNLPGAYGKNVKPVQ